MAPGPAHRLPRFGAAEFSATRGFGGGGCAGRDSRRHLSADARGGQAGDGAERGRIAPPCRTHRARARYGRTDPRSHRSPDRARCSHGSGRGYDPVGSPDDQEAAAGAGRRPIPRGQRNHARGSRPPALGIQRKRAGRRRRLPGQRQRRGRLVIGRHRAGPDDRGNLGGSGRDTQLPRDRGRGGFRPLHDVDREHPVEDPKTGRITALSALAALRKLHSPLRIGT